MPDTSLPVPPGFNALSKAEQVLYLQALWDQISEDPDALPVPESHLRLVEDRLKRYREDPSRARSGFEVIDRLISNTNFK
jgi:Putative addiction module component